MFRFCFIGIAIFAVFNLNLAEEYESVETVDATQHLIPDSKPLQLIDPSSVKHFSILDVLTPKPLTSAIISSNVENASAKTLTNSSCLTLVLADNLKEHITPDNLEPVTVLLQHSLETCPGLKSTFEILQKMMDIKGMSIDEAIEFIQKLTIVQGNSEGQIEHETSDAESKDVSTSTIEDVHVENSKTSTSAPEIVTESTPEPETESSTLEAEAENEETNVEPSEEELEIDNTNPLDVIQSVVSMLENDPQFAPHLTESNEEDADNENSENESPIIHEPQH
uniref:Uncharacterized protein n=1 Tax=Panagrolaimus davidi TaxID=227884 RepID=A0A914PIA4_9BILA